VRQKTHDLVRQLGDASFQAREQASRELLALGLAAKEALQEGARDPDPEVRRRCEDLLPAVLEADRRARVQAFIADRRGAETDHGLPGWQRFRQAAGDGAVARQLFVDIQKSEAAYFLEDVEKAPAKAAELCAGRCQYLQQKLYNPLDGRYTPLPLHEVAALLLVAADPKVRLPNAYLVGNFLYQPAVRVAVADKVSGAPFRHLVLVWLRRQLDDDNSTQYALQIITQLNLKEGLDVALEAARARKVKGVGLAAVLTAVGKLGEKEHVAILESYLDDTTLVSNFGLNRGGGTTQVGDVALAMAVHLTGQSHRDYGFYFAQSNPSLKFYPHFLGFTSEAQRAQAQRKWQEWKTAQEKK